jgi:hypothetical protein
VPGPLSVIVPECGPVMVLVQAEAAEASVVMNPIPESAANAEIGVRMVMMIFEYR